MTATFGDKTCNAASTADQESPLSGLILLTNSSQKYCPKNIRTFSAGFVKSISSGQGHTSARQGTRKGCTAGSEIALFTGSELLDPSDPLVKPHSKI